MSDDDGSGGGSGSGSESGEWRTWEHLEHPADIQIHAFGPTLEHAFSATALGMFDYMTDLDGVEIDEKLDKILEADGTCAKFFFFFFFFFLFRIPIFLLPTPLLADVFIFSYWPGLESTADHYI
jgi:hypothetical protein